MHTRLTRRFSSSLLAAALVAVMVLGVAAVAQTTAGGIDSIAPAKARKGELVTIQGHGFGSINVRVTVGGVPAQLVRVNGFQVTFIVPDGVKPGLTQVVATNPGFQTGSIQFRMLEGILLPGNPMALAKDALFDMPPVEVSDDAVQDGIILTRLDLRLKAGATVGDVNKALVKLDSGIVTMGKGLLFATVAVPRANSVAELQQVAQALAATAGFEWALVGGPSQPQILPTTPGSFTDNQLLPTRFPAAWNVKHLAVNGCETRAVPIFVADDFASGLLPAGYESSFSNQIETPGSFKIVPSGATGTEVHGYDVTATIAALFDSASPTGANSFTQCLDITGIRVKNLMPGEEVFRIAQNLPLGTRFLLNYSRAFRGKCEVIFDFSTNPPTERCSQGSVLSIPNAFDRAESAVEWKKLTAAFWDTFLVVPSAGNFRAGAANPDGFAAGVYPGLGIARFASAFNIATDADSLFGFVANSGLWFPQSNSSILPDLTAQPPDVQQLVDDIKADGLDTVGRAQNVVITGSTEPGAAFTDLIESNFSNLNPDLVAVGEQIHKLDGGFTQGTSFSAPQLTGLASYLWLLSDDLRNTQPASTTRRAILQNTRLLPLAGQVTDAYATVLSLDPVGGAPDPNTWKVRLALLDLNDDGLFNETDLSAWVGVLLDSSGKPISDPPNRDYSRFDLNGDGFTGGTRTEQFDLDRSGSVQYGRTDYANPVTEEIEGQTTTFQKGRLTDVNILCYYAYSPLYTGDTDIRRQLLAGACGIAVKPASVTLRSGQQQQFTAVAPSNDTVTWSTSGGCGSIDQSTGLFTASTPGTCSVKATDSNDPNLFGTAAVTVQNGGAIALTARSCSTQALGLSFFRSGGLLEPIKSCTSFPPPPYMVPDVRISNSVDLYHYSANYTEGLSAGEVTTNSISQATLDVVAEVDAPLIVAGVTTNPNGVETRSTAELSFTIQDGGTYLVTVKGQISSNNIFALQSFGLSGGGQPAQGIGLNPTACTPTGDGIPPSCVEPFEISEQVTGTVQVSLAADSGFTTAGITDQQARKGEVSVTVTFQKVN